MAEKRAIKQPIFPMSESELEKRMQNAKRLSKEEFENRIKEINDGRQANKK